MKTKNKSKVRTGNKNAKKPVVKLATKKELSDVAYGSTTRDAILQNQITELSKNAQDEKALGDALSIQVEELRASVNNMTLLLSSTTQTNPMTDKLKEFDTGPGPTESNSAGDLT